MKICHTNQDEKTKETTNTSDSNKIISHTIFIFAGNMHLSHFFHCEFDAQRWVIEGGGIITLSSTIVYQYWTGHNNYNTGWSTTGAQQLLYRVITTGPTCHYLINIVIIIKTMLIYFLVCSTLLCLVHYDWNLYGQLWMRHWDLQMKQSEVSLYGITNMINIFIFPLS